MPLLHGLNAALEAAHVSARVASKAMGIPKSWGDSSATRYLNIWSYLSIPILLLTSQNHAAWYFPSDLSSPVPL